MHPSDTRDSEVARPIRRSGRRRRVVRWLWRNLNFYRVHLLGFVITPLLASIIFYFSNGEYHISYVDSLFLCVTSMTVCGLATVNLSTLTGFQQAIMYILMWIGHPITISIIVIQSRMWIFEEHLEPLVRKRQEEREARRRRNSVNGRWPKRVLSVFGPNTNTTSMKPTVTVESVKEDRDSPKKSKLNVRMIRRMSNAPQRVNPSGHVMEHRAGEAPVLTPDTNQNEPQGVLQESPKSISPEIPRNSPPDIEIRHPTGDDYMTMSPEPISQSSSPSQEAGLPLTFTQENHHAPLPWHERGASTAIARTQTMQRTQTMPRTQTVEFALPRPIRAISVERGEKHDFPTHQTGEGRRPSMSGEDRTSQQGHNGLERYSSRTGQFPRTVTGASTKRRGSRHTGFGGFPTPYRLLIRFVSWIAPATAERIRLRLTVPRTPSLKVQPTKSIASQTIEAALRTEKKMVEEDLEFLGGVEYKALKLLRLIVIGYHVGIQVIGFAFVVGSATEKRWLPVFEAQPRFIPPAWFAVFQVTSAYTNTGTSLSDQSMIPFQSASLMIIAMFVLILAGNTAFPIFLRILIWAMKKCAPANAPIQEPLHFLLKHPRRCYIYLFPSHQTFFLLTMILTLTVTDWVCFLVLDIGNPITDSVPVGRRILIGLLQASAVRAAGFSTVALSALAPAVKVLYVIMMYVSVYPIAMSVRSTNVYEEKSLGIFDDEPGSENSSLLSAEHHFGDRTNESRRKVWGEYLLWHARQQLAFDMWWLALALWIICIIEKGPLMNPDNESWFNIFSVVFEVVSAYGTVGMSLGLPYDNYSTCGAFSTLSKIVICAVMIRGRHRGLPVAIDRAIVLPSEYAKDKEQAANDFPMQPRFTADFPSNAPSQDPNVPLRDLEHNNQHLGTQLEAVPESSRPNSRPTSSSGVSFLSSAETQR